MSEYGIELDAPTCAYCIANRLDGCPRCSGENDVPTLRYFLDGREVTETEAIEAEASGVARVTKGGSGVVPEDLRQPGETRDEWIRPWIALATRVSQSEEWRDS